ncbi:hypothetical protein SBV1_340047 [Verrucomicrobia bacterium]|nr:hypothetical protein SBV1_340047 [Verrucomicrobiota bacterium]
MDLQQMPAVKRYLCAALNAARATHLEWGSADKDLNRGAPRRTFADIASSELAANILPRLENLLNCWGLLVDQAGRIEERALSGEEEARLTRTYHPPI